MNILVLNAGGSGNVGDDMYNYIFKKEFDDVSLMFCNDYHILTSDNTFVSILDYNPSLHNIMPFNYLIIGGGGLFREISYNSSLRVYTNYCITHSIPYFMISVGFQDVEYNIDIDSFKKKYMNISFMFEHANYISVRTITDYALCRTLVSNNQLHYIDYYPDLVYSSRKYFPICQDISRDIILLCPTELFKTHICLKDISEENCKIINFDGINGKHNGELNMLDGLIPTDPFIKHNRTLTLPDICNILLRCKEIRTGRYHGVILSKVFGVPHINTFGYCNYKFLADEFSHHTIMSNEQLAYLSELPLIKIKQFITRRQFYASKTWSEDFRNYIITKINTIENIDISICQNMTNRRLEEYMFKNEWQN